MRTDIKERVNQIKNSEIPEGYKKTKLGIIPKDWTVCTIGDCLERVGKPVEVIPDEKYVQIGIRSHGKGLFDKEAVTGAELGNKAVFWIEPDCFILNIVFAWEQAIGRTTVEDRGKIGSHRFPMYRPKNKSVDIDYLVYFFMTKRGKDILEAASPGGAGRNKTLGQDRFMKSKLVLPPLEEQKKIVHLLSMQDKVIVLQQKTIDELLMYKKALLQKMFPSKGDKYPEIRFKGFTDAWEQRKLEEVTDEFKSGSFIAAANIEDEGMYPVYGGNGIRGYVDTFNHDGEFALIGRQGALCGNMNYSVGKAYFTEHAVAVKANCTSNTRFLYYLLDKMNLGQYSDQSAQPGLAVGKLIKLESLFPAKEEQDKISAYFSSIDDLITLHQREFDTLKKQKKGIIQKIFAREVRFKKSDGSDYPDWKDDTLGDLGTFMKGASLSKADICETGSPFILYGELYTTYGEVAYKIVRKTEAIVDKKYYSTVGDVIIPTSGESPEEISTATCIMVPNVILAGDLNIYRSSIVDGRVMSYLLNHQINNKIAKIAQGKSVVHIQAKNLEKLSVCYPIDKEEQQKIAGFLSDYDTAIELAKQELEKWKLLKKGLLQQMFV